MDEMTEAEAAATAASRKGLRWVGGAALVVAVLGGTFYAGMAYRDTQWRDWSETNRWACLYGAEDLNYPGFVCDLHDPDENPL